MLFGIILFKTHRQDRNIPQSMKRIKSIRSIILCRRRCLIPSATQETFLQDLIVVVVVVSYFPFISSHGALISLPALTFNLLYIYIYIFFGYLYNSRFIIADLLTMPETSEVDWKKNQNQNNNKTFFELNVWWLISWNTKLSCDFSSIYITLYLIILYLYLWIIE